MESVACLVTGTEYVREQQGKEKVGSFQLPLHYPRYLGTDYKTMPEWKLDSLFSQYGLLAVGRIEQKREFAIGAFLWPD